MFSANLELVQSIYARWARGEFLTDASWAHPEIECVVADGPTPGARNGVAGMATLWREIVGAYEDFQATAEESIELDSRRVLVLVQFSGRGKTSGLELAQMDTKNTSLFEIEDGLVTKLVLYWDRDRAFADLGLAPEVAQPD